MVCLLLQTYTDRGVRSGRSWSGSRCGDEHPVGKVRHALRLVTQPLLAPLRALIPPVRMGAVAVDLSPLVLILGLNLLAGAIC